MSNGSPVEAIVERLKPAITRIRRTLRDYCRTQRPGLPCCPILGGPGSLGLKCPGHMARKIWIRLTHKVYADTVENRRPEELLRFGTEIMAGPDCVSRNTCALRKSGLTPSVVEGWLAQAGAIIAAWNFKGQLPPPLKLTHVYKVESESSLSGARFALAGPDRCPV